MTLTSTRIRLAAVAAAALALGGLTACAPQDEGDDAAASPSASASCAAADLDTKAEGKLTIATGKPAYGPWFEDDDPANGKGFESAVAYATAEQLGFAKDAVVWTSADFNASVAPGPKDWDVNLQQFSITDERKQAVDFSSGYYEVKQGVVTTASSKAANAASLADLKKVKIGAQVGTTSAAGVNQVIKPDTQPAVFNTNDEAKLALESGQIDALAVDLPTAIYLADAELTGGKVIGQLPPVEGADTEEFGFVLEKGSPLTSCVTQAVDALREDGTLTKIETEWLTNTRAPLLK